MSASLRTICDSRHWATYSSSTSQPNRRAPARYPLSQTHPITTTLTDPDGIGGVPPVTYGVARDGITAVLFNVSGRPVNVPVRDNFFAYEGRPFETVFSFSAVTALEGGE